MPNRSPADTALLTSDPKADRAIRRRSSKMALRHALTVLHVSDDALAMQLGVSRARLRSWIDLGERAQIGLGEVVGLPIVAKRVLVEILAGEIGCELVDRADSIEDAGPITLSSDVASSGGESARVVAEAVRDGAIDRGEVADLRRVARRMRKEARRLEVVSDDADRDGVRPIRSTR